MFVEKTMEEFEAMTSKEQGEYLLAKKENDAKVRKEELDNAIAEANKNNATKEELEALTSKQANVVKELELIASRIQKMSEPTSTENQKSFAQALNDAITEKSAEFEKLANGEISAVKAVVNITDATTIDAAGSASQYTLTTNTGIVSKLRSRLVTYLSNVSVGRIRGNRAMWIEELDEQGTPVMIAEAATKTKISVRYEERERKSSKIGVHAKVTTEFLRNLPQLVSYVQNNLIKRVDIATEDGLLNGDGTLPNLKGIITYASAFTGGSLNNTMTAPKPADVFRAIALQVQEAYGMASAVFVSPGVLANLDIEKDTNGAYLLPPFRSADGLMVAGMQLIPTSGLPVGTDFVGGDLSVVNVAFASPMTVQVDMSGDDFINNMRTVLVEQELVQWVSANDTAVLVKGDIASAITALTA
jgi:HK97 family phage major capsid protein